MAGYGYKNTGYGGNEMAIDDEERKKLIIFGSPNHYSSESFATARAQRIVEDVHPPVAVAEYTYRTKGKVEPPVEDYALNTQYNTQYRAHEIDAAAADHDDDGQSPYRKDFILVCGIPPVVVPDHRPTTDSGAQKAQRVVSQQTRPRFQTAAWQKKADPTAPRGGSGATSYNIQPVYRKIINSDEALRKYKGFKVP